MQTFEMYIVVAQDDLDNLHHVNNVRYVQWVQDIAEQHWKSKITESIQERYFWVLMKHTIEYKNEAVLGDVLKLVTYIKECKGVTSIRAVDIFDENTDKRIASSETTWCFMNVGSKRPARITQEVLDLFN